VVVRLPSGTRDDVNAIGQLRLPLKDAPLVPLRASAASRSTFGAAASPARTASATSAFA